MQTIHDIAGLATAIAIGVAVGGVAYSFVTYAISLVLFSLW